METLAFLQFNEHHLGYSLFARTNGFRFNFHRFLEIGQIWQVLDIFGL